MNFELDPLVSGIKGMVNTFAKFQMRPVAQKYDELQEMPWDLMKKAAQMGMSGMGEIELGSGGGKKPEKESDPKKSKNPLAGKANLIGVVGAEELAWGCAGIGLALAGSGLAATPVNAMANPEQRKVFYDALKGDDEKGHPHIAAMAMTEPNSGSDISSIKTTAVADGDYYVLNGTKRFITNGYSANVFVIWATIDPAAGRSGHRAFVITRGTPGLVPGKKEDKLGIRASETAEVYLEDCRVHKDMMLGKKESSGFAGAKAMFDSTRPMVGAMATGIGRAAYEFALDWAKTKKRGGKLLIEDSAVRARLGYMSARVEAARYSVWHAAWLADQKQTNVKEASLCKAFAAGVATEACIDAMDICGPESLSREYQLEKWFRDIKIYDIFEGTGQIQRRIIARELTGLKAQ